MAVEVLVVGPEGPARDALEAALSRVARDGGRVESLDDPKAALALAREPWTRRLVVLGPHLAEGLAWIGRLHAVDPELPVVVAAERGDVERAADAVAAGARDFLVCGANLDDRVTTLLGKLEAFFDVLERNRKLGEQNEALRAALQERFHIVGASPQVQTMLEQVRRVAEIPRPVLVVGERGTGKELIAHAIHRAQRDDPGPMVTVNCAAFSDPLLESELFGHEKGAFTGADRAQPGKFEQADGGALFLDEVGHMSLAFQQKILRAVEYGTFTRVGGVQELHSSVRIIAATNVDLRERIREGEFLSDLYDRLAFEVIRVPPLREREGDVELLARHFLEEFAREMPEFRGKSLSRRAIEALEAHPFPGNVRELKNVIERAAYRDTTNEITPRDLGLDEPGAPPARGAFKEQVDAFARSLLARALEDAGGNQAAAARALGLTYAQFRYHRSKLGIAS